MRFLRGLAGMLLWLEPLLLGLIGLAMWYPTPTRSDWLWTLLLLVPVYLARYFLRGRFFTRTPLDLLFLTFLLLGVFNVYAAPHSRGLMMLARALFGMACAYALVERARVGKSMRGPLLALTLLALLVGVLALGSTQWSSKAQALQGIIDVLPRITGFPGAEGGFNSNEIAGVLAWLTPLMIGLALYRWHSGGQRWAVTLAALLLVPALLLGQSRSALAGVLFSLIFVIGLIVPAGRWRWGSWALLALAMMLQVGVMLNHLTDNQAQVAEAQDSGEEVQSNLEISSGIRLEIWQAAIQLTRDYPLTGVGMGMFRYEFARAAYPIPSMAGTILAHAHNEYLQMAVDMGLPGLAVFIWFYIFAGYMALQIWRQGDAQARAVAVAVAGGLLAHAIYGLADAITLWDRFTFVFWLMLGLLAAQYWLVTQTDPMPDEAQSMDIA